MESRSTDPRPVSSARLELVILAPGLVMPIPLFFVLRAPDLVTLLVAAGALAAGWAVWAYVAEWALVRRHRGSPFDPEWMP